jgi:hypothetical protein
MRGAEGEFDVARNDRPVAVAAELIEPWFARHAVDVGLQFDRDVADGSWRCRSRRQANLEFENRIGSVRIEPWRG